ncbi:LysR family transcriptional regulator [Trabulsiella guamensis ATCC 49490]|uniref:LysR family transcriptional regulator n=1 Tax=Trabulsiella guamensis ATCC 49490 TaxID=1005994 RepID=A0A084ZP05_9ENTR|nr:LysR substrate-binding domain-containing protein [Trabulsiella guamensis]KFB99199.1 LysR family transcriptional regulator [Trabulsiella guamensis ATCC 49490]
MNINENDFRGVDLNLLITFMVLFREQHVSAAASKLHLGQPAVSASLARLRNLFNDPLFIRSGQRMQPTFRAVELHQSLLPLLSQLQSSIFAPPKFDPATVQATLTLGMTDWVEMLLMPRLLPVLARKAPGLRVNTVISDPFTDTQRLEKGELDMAVSVATPSMQHIRRVVVAPMNFLVLWEPAQLALETPVSAEQYAALRHVMVSYKSANRSQIDTLLEAKGLSRDVTYSTPYFSGIPGLLKNMPVIATVPYGLGELWRDQYGFTSSVLDLDIPSFEVALLWHERHDSHAALMWLKEIITELFA